MSSALRETGETGGQTPERAPKRARETGGRGANAAAHRLDDERTNGHPDRRNTERGQGYGNGAADGEPTDPWELGREA